MRAWLLSTLLVLGTIALSAQDHPEEQEPKTRISLFFGGGSYYLFPEEGDRLQEFLDAVPDIEMYEIEIQGHTDDIGDREYNLVLSNYRAQTVLQRLLEYPIPAESIETLPLGEEAPSYDNETWEGKLSNRRVDVILKPVIL